MLMELEVGFWFTVRLWWGMAFQQKWDGIFHFCKSWLTSLGSLRLFRRSRQGIVMRKIPGVPDVQAS